MAMKDRKTKLLVPQLRFPEFRGAGEWPASPLQEIAYRITTRNDDGSVTRVLTNSAEYGVLDQSDYFDREIATAGKTDGYFVVNGGDFVYNPRKSTIAPVGPISRNNLGQGVMSPLYTVFRFKTDDTDFFEHYFRSGGWHTYLRNASSTGARHDRMAITAGAFMRMPVPTPSPAEQRKIAECLTSLDALIAACGRKLATLATHKKGLMQQLFPSPGESLPRLRFPEFRDEPEWEAKRVGERGDVLAGKALAVNAPGPLRPYLRTKNVLDGSIDLSDVLTMPMTDAEFNRFEVLDGDILLNEGQSLELVGRTSMYRGEFGDRCAMQNQLLRFRAFPSTSPEFAEQAFRQCQKDGTFASIATKTTSVAHLGSSRFTALELTWPAIDEQRRIAACLGSLDAALAAEAQALATLRTHKKGLVQQLFPSPEGD
jgi:type I restriction enzyme S subunit